MNKKISTYKDLLEEKERLQILLGHQREVLREDMREIKEELQTFRTVLGVVKKFTKSDKGNAMMNMASGKVIDFVLRKLVLARAGWLARVTLPFLAKNFTSHVIADNKRNILGTLAGWFNKMRGHKPKRSFREPEPVHEEFRVVPTPYQPGPATVG